MDGNHARAFARVLFWSGDLMTQVLAVTTGLFRDRDFFIHDGAKLRRFRVSAPLQAVFFVVLLGLVAWASFATAQLLTRPHGTSLSLPAATEARAQMIEKRQALIEAALAGQKITADQIAAASGGRLTKDGPLARVEQAQLEQAALVAKALDVRYQVTTAELKQLGISPGACRQQRRRRRPVRERRQFDLQGAVRQLEEARPAPGRRDRHSVRQAGQDEC